MSEKTGIHRKLKELSTLAHNEMHVIMLLADYVGRHPEDLAAASAYGDALRIVGRSTDAVRVLQAVFERAGTVTMKSAMAMRIAMALESTAREEAEKWYARAVEHNASLPGWGWILRGANLASLERFEAAIDCYGRALKSKDIDRDEALTNMARAYRALGDHVTALTYVKRALAVNPNDRELKRLKAGFDDLERTREFARRLREDE